MLRYIAFRSLVALFLVWVVVSVVFLLLHLIPGDPAELLLSTGNVAADPAAVAALREQMGLNDPIWQQYLDHMAGVLTGDLGQELARGRERTWKRQVDHLTEALKKVAVGSSVTLLVVRDDYSCADFSKLVDAAVAKKVATPPAAPETI